MPARAWPLLLLAVALAATAGAAPPPPRTPVIIDTDIGDDIDDTWALALALKSPELDVKLVVTDFGNTGHRAKIVARVLEAAARTDVPIGIGVKENDNAIPQGDWVKGYDLEQFRGRVLKDGVQALVDTVMASDQPTTLIAIGPPTNLKAALEREVLILTRAAGERRSITSLLRELAIESDIPLSTLKLNARVLRELKLISYGSRIDKKQVKIEPLGGLILKIMTDPKKAVIKFPD